MKAAKTLIAAVALSSASAASFAGGYVGINYAHIDLEIESYSVDLAAVVARAGYQFNEWIALEARAGMGVRDDDVRILDTKFDVKLDNLFGGYLIAGVPTASAFYPYAVVGFTRARAEVSGSGLREADSDEDFSYGIGANFAVTDQMSVNVEAIRYLDNDVEADSIGVGLHYRF